LGILLVSLVTTMPEAAAVIAAARMDAMDLGVAGIYGSCAFNITVLAYADPFYRAGILANQTEPAHFVAGGIAIGMMLVGFALILSRDRVKSAVATAVLAIMAVVYLAGAVAVATLGQAEDEDEPETARTGVPLNRTPGE
jgi:cation:H+ antiporter